MAGQVSHCPGASSPSHRLGHSRLCAEAAGAGLWGILTRSPPSVPLRHFPTAFEGSLPGAPQRASLPLLDGTRLSASGSPCTNLT